MPITPATNGSLAIEEEEEEGDIQGKRRDLSTLQIIKKISSSKQQVLLTYSPKYHEYFAMKVFNFDDQRMNNHFLNEIRFSWISHPNIISIHDIQKNRLDLTGGCQNQVSYIVMELAPYGDFADFIEKNLTVYDEVLARTYFHQLIDAVEYLHNHNVCHLDIKLENILIGKGYQLKLIDFDHSYFQGDKTLNGGGTQNFRAPELIEKKRITPRAADIYSAGIILFCFKSGILPYCEDSTVEGFDLRKMLIEGQKNFWRVHEYINSREPEYSEDFKELLFSMTTMDPKRRPCISEIKQSKWYQGPTYSEEELVVIMSNQISSQVLDESLGHSEEM